MDILKYWNADNFEISSYKWHLDDRKNKIHTTSGSDNTHLCRYTYNELGFRGDSIHKKGFKVMSLGCSLTEGVGVNDNETWPAHFCSHIDNSVNFNFGVGGRSNDFIVRCLLSYFDLIKPDLVLIMYTYPTRKEYYTKLGGVEPYIPAQSWGFFEDTSEGIDSQNLKDRLQNDNEDFINWYKNHLLITNFLENKKIPLAWSDAILETSYNDNNKFSFDYNSYLDFGVDGTHPGPKQHEIYAKHLFNYVQTKKLL
jgi:lysophospholipase L1-like esterase